jgi:hypothetical protein
MSLKFSKIGTKREGAPLKHWTTKRILESNPTHNTKGENHEKHTMDKADEEGALLQGSF